MKRKFMVLLVMLFYPFCVYADTSHASIVMDVDSGRVLYEKNSSDKRLIASTTKIMTCIIVLENSDIEREITVGNEVLSMYGTNIYIEPGERMKIKDLLYGLILRSGNDAAITLAVNTLGIENFISKMNEKALEIGMTNTKFQNPHGLDDDTENISTAYDMALLARYAYQNEIYKSIIATHRYKVKSSLKSYTWYNRMSLTNHYKNCVGGKNGYTPKAGKTLVSYAKKDNFTLTVVTLGDADIYENHKNLYESIFNKYKRYLIIDKDNMIFNSYLSNEQLFIKKNFNYPLKSNEVDNVSTVLELYNKTKKGKRGIIKIFLDDNSIGEVDVYEKNDKKKKDLNIFQRIIKLFVG